MTHQNADPAEPAPDQRPPERGPADQEPADQEPADQDETDRDRAAHCPTDHVRTEAWSCDGVAELDLSVELGRIEVTLTDQASDVRLEVRAGPLSDTAWGQGLSGLLGWLGQAARQDWTQEGSSRHGWVTVGGRSFPFGGDLRIGDLDVGELLRRELGGRDLAAEAVRATEVRWSPAGRRLEVRSPRNLPSRLVPLELTVQAPAGARLVLRTGSADVTVTGRAGDTATRTGSGDVRLDAVDGDVEVAAGSGTVATGAVRGRTRAKTGSGDLSVATLGGVSEVRAGSGTVRLGGVRADLLARVGSGDLTIGDAEAGRLDLTTGSGNVRVGVHAGVTAELDISSRSGRVRSELGVVDSAPPGAGALVVRGRTGSGDVLVTRAVS